MNSAWDTILVTVQQEFSDLPDLEQFTRVLVRLLMAMLLGALIGYERERSDSAAGLRTHMLVALGAALFVLAPLQAGIEIADLSRVLQGVIAGIGFLGAGAVLKLKEDGVIKGLTTAASIWATAAIGITVGLGLEATAVLSTVLVLVILYTLFRVSKNIDKRNEARRLESKTVQR
jgi:putative Mg2+ transporter-C (MgtC) family protein